MLVDYYVGALLAEEGLADDIWELWDAGMISDDLAAWAERVAAQEWSEAFVFFKHEEEAAGPRMAARFLELAAR